MNAEKIKKVCGYFLIFLGVTLGIYVGAVLTIAWGCSKIGIAGIFGIAAGVAICFPGAIMLGD